MQLWYQGYVKVLYVCLCFVCAHKYFIQVLMHVSLVNYVWYCILLSDLFMTFRLDWLLVTV